jgi:hypothetical protein
MRAPGLWLLFASCLGALEIGGAVDIEFNWFVPAEEHMKVFSKFVASD